VVHIGFWWSALRAKDHLEHLDVDGRTILNFIFKMWDNLDWIEVFHDRDRR